MLSSALVVSNVLIIVIAASSAVWSSDGLLGVAGEVKAPWKGGCTLDVILDASL